MLCSNFAAVIVMTCMAVMSFNSTPQPTSWDAQQEVLEAEPVDLIASVRLTEKAKVKVGT